MVYKKVVVPLDGSKLAEIVLPHVEEIVTGCNVSDVELITVTEGLRVQVPKSEPVEQFKTAPAVGDRVTGRIYRTDSSNLLKVTVDIGKMAKTGGDYLAKIAARLEKIIASLK